MTYIYGYIMKYFENLNHLSISTFRKTSDRFAKNGLYILVLWIPGSRKNPFFVLQLWKSHGQIQFSMLNLEKFVTRLKTLDYKNWSHVFENIVFWVVLVPLSILTVARRGKGSRRPGRDIRTHCLILYRIEAEKQNLFFHCNFALRASYIILNSESFFFV